MGLQHSLFHVVWIIVRKIHSNVTGQHENWTRTDSAFLNWGTQYTAMKWAVLSQYHAQQTSHHEDSYDTNTVTVSRLTHTGAMACWLCVARLPFQSPPTLPHGITTCVSTCTLIYIFLSTEIYSGPIWVTASQVSQW